MPSPLGGHCPPVSTDTSSSSAGQNAIVRQCVDDTRRPLGAGWWATTGATATGATTTGRADGSGAAGTEGTASPALADPADVKGSTTVQQVVDAFPAVTAAEVLEQFGAPLDTPTSTQLKSLVEAGDGTDIPAIRTWLGERATG
jgi:hypothetical protein